jgi:hypothetical protein
LHSQIEWFEDKKEVFVWFSLISTRMSTNACWQLNIFYSNKNKRLFGLKTVYAFHLLQSHLKNYRIVLLNCKIRLNGAHGSLFIALLLVSQMPEQVKTQNRS